MTRTPHDVEDELLVLQCQRGDENALRELIVRWQPRLARFAWRMTGDREATRDLVQDTWLAVVRRIRRLDDPAAFRGWAYRIAANKCTDWVRRRMVARRAAGQAMPPGHADDRETPSQAESADEINRLRAELSRLPGEQRVILALYYLEEMRVADIAEVLSIPSGTVKSRLFHARKQLKDALERNER